MAHEGDADTYCNWIDSLTRRLGNINMRNCPVTRHTVDLYIPI